MLAETDKDPNCRILRTEPSPPRSKQSLWRESPATGKFVSPQLSFQRERRFEWSSIYWPRDQQNSLRFKFNRQSEVDRTACRISKCIDIEERNQARFSDKRKFSPPNLKALAVTPLRQVQRKQFRLSQKNQKVVRRLSATSIKQQSLQRDRYGQRSSLPKDPEREAQSVPRFMAESTGFKTSKKVQLDRPNNYNPGPGAYEVKRYPSSLERSSVPILIRLIKKASLQ